MELIKLWFTKFRGLRTLKGITEDEFNPLDMFIKEGKRVHSISWTIPEKEDLRKQVLDFLQFNQTVDLRLYGGTLEKIKIDTLYLTENTKSLTLIDMPSIDMTHVFETLPELTSIHIQNVDELKKENFLAMYRRLVTYKGLTNLTLELLSFDIEEVKQEFLEILYVHSDSLRNISLGRNRVSNQFMKEICSSLKEGLAGLENLNLLHLKETNKIDWS